ncbi:MAG TPA: hypothetical protein VKY57_03905 [Chitinispirillaceae bacterium]|nr:hypothetical protein [Chitinispirillaceae bacterium]
MHNCRINEHGNFLFLVLLIITASYPVTLKTDINSDKLTVGDILYLKISANIPKNSVLVPPETENHINNIVIKEWNTTKTEFEEFDSISVDYTLTTYIPQNCTIPSLPFILNNSEETTDTLFSKAIPLEVISVITEADSNIDIKDLKPQQTAGKAPMWWLWVIGSLLLITVLILLAKILFRKTQKSFAPPPPKPPFEEAISAIHELEYKNYLQRGLVREYCFELSEIFKRYIARRFYINAEEFTTEEMVAWLGISGLELKYRNSVEWFFRTTDLVKFARHTPDNSIVDRFMNEVISFLEATKPIETEPNEKQTGQKETETAQTGDGEKQ